MADWGEIVDTLLTTLPYYLCSIAAYGTSALGAVMVHKRLYPRRVLLLAAAFALLGTVFFLLAVSSTRAGIVDRRALALAIRLLALAGGVLWLAWLALAVRATVGVERR